VRSLVGILGLRHLVVRSQDLVVLGMRPLALAIPCCWLLEQVLAVLAALAVVCPMAVREGVYLILADNV
jgi:hypothetical protein